MPEMRYRTGETVALGDHIMDGEWPAVVKAVLRPGSQSAADFACPQGGILVEEDLEGKPNLVSIPRLPEDLWDAVVFVRRAGEPASG